MPTKAIRPLFYRGVKRASLRFRQCERLWPKRGACCLMSPRKPWFCRPLSGLL